MSKEFNVFISWSGDRSKLAAEALREWLPMVLQDVEPWMSDSDIDKGTSWSAEISDALSNIKLGVVCLTPENLESPWLNYESGALSKTVDEKTRVWTYLLAGLKFEQVKPPLGMFQHTSANKEDTRKLVNSINSAVNDEPMPQARLDLIFEAMWPRLEEKLSAIPTKATTEVSERSAEEMIAEILAIVRTDTPRRRDEMEVQLTVLQREREFIRMENMKLQEHVAYLMAQLGAAMAQNKASANNPDDIEKTFVVLRKLDKPPGKVKAIGYVQDGEAYKFMLSNGKQFTMQHVEAVFEVEKLRTIVVTKPEPTQAFEFSGN